MSITLFVLLMLGFLAGAVFGVIFFVKGIRPLMKNNIGPGIANLLISALIFVITGLYFSKILLPMLRQLAG